MLPELRGIIDDGSPCRRTKTQIVAHVLVDEHLRRRHPRSLSRTLQESAEEKMLDAVMQQARAQVVAEHAEARRKPERAEVRDFATPVQAVVALLRSLI